jgi:hypothetical protein
MRALRDQVVVADDFHVGFAILRFELILVALQDQASVLPTDQMSSIRLH